MAAGTPLTIRLLGPIEVGADRRPLPGTKQARILGLLAVRSGAIVTTDALVDALWPRGRPAHPERSLQVHVSNLRRELADASPGAAIDYVDRGYVLQVAREAIDVRRFEELIGEGTALVDDEPARAREVLAGALALWRGRPLGPLADEPSVRGVVARLEDLRIRAVELRIDADLRTGRHREVANELRGLTRDHPMREGLWGRLMVALYRSGRQAEALQAYEAARRILADELGTDPAPALRDLHARVLRQDPTLAADPPPPAVRVARRDPGTVSLAVLPFDVFGESEDVELLAQGLHNDLLTELSKVRALTVISRTSVMRYRGSDTPIPRIAEDLNVTAVVEGTIQSAGRRLRLTVQLIDGTQDVHLWADSFACELTAENVFALQTALARQIARSLADELSVDAIAREGRSRTRSLDAYRLVARARQQLDLRTEAGFERAVELYREALDLDPEYADAWTGLADALTLTDAYGHGDHDTLLPAAEHAVHQALTLDPDSAGARTSLATLLTIRQHGPAAREEFERALELQPSHADAHNIYCWLLLLTGRAEQALVAAERTVDLDPLSAEPLAHLALARTALADPASGVAAARRARMFSSYTTADLYEGLCLYELGLHAQAVEVLRPLTVAERGERGVAWAGHAPEVITTLALVALDEVEAARDVLAGLGPAPDAFDAGLMLLGLGDVDAAAARLRHATELSAWPCLAVHHYFEGVWASIAGTPIHDDVLRSAYRSFRLEPPPSGR